MTQLHPSTPPADAPRRYGPVTDPDQRAQAFRQMGLADASMSDRLVRRKVAATADSGVSMDYLWGAFAGSAADAGAPHGRLDASVWVIPQAGRSGIVFMSRPSGRAGVGVVAGLLDAVCTALPAERVALAQTLLMPTEDLHRAAADAAGFQTLATLCYLQATVPHRLPDPRPPAGVRLLPYRPPHRELFIAALEASYDQTLDCPGLRGVRDIDDVLAGHMGAGRFDPDLWTLATVDDAPAAVCLLNPIEESGCCELVYLGVGTRHRRRGLASLLLERARALCAQHGYGVVTLAVDESNTPAVELYTRFRFHRTARKIAMVRRIDGASAR